MFQKNRKQESFEVIVNEKHLWRAGDVIPMRIKLSENPVFYGLAEARRRREFFIFLPV